MLLPTLVTGAMCVSLSSCGTTYKELRTKRGSQPEKKVEEVVKLTQKKKVVVQKPVPQSKVEEKKLHPGNISGIQFTAPDVSQKLPTQKDSEVSLSEQLESEAEKVILATPEAPEEVLPQ